MGNAPFVKAWEIKEGQQGPGIAVVGHGLSPLVDKMVHSIFPVRANVPPPLLVEDELVS